MPDNSNLQKAANASAAGDHQQAAEHVGNEAYIQATHGKLREAIQLNRQAAAITPSEKRKKDFEGAAGRQERMLAEDSK
jgi:hypothetical protein